MIALKNAHIDYVCSHSIWEKSPESICVHQVARKSQPSQRLAGAHKPSKRFYPHSPKPAERALKKAATLPERAWAPWATELACELSKVGFENAMWSVPLDVHMLRGCHGDTSSLIDSNPSALLHCLLRIDVVRVEDVPPQAASSFPKKNGAMVPWSTCSRLRHQCFPSVNCVNYHSRLNHGVDPSAQFVGCC